MENTTVKDAKITQHAGSTGDDFSICQWLYRAKIFNSNLMELTHSALLRTFVAKHRASIEIFKWQGLGQTIRNHCPHNTSRIFRAQCQALTTAVGKIISLLGDNIAAVPKRS